jgi:hypothetical protein
VDTTEKNDETNVAEITDAERNDKLVKDGDELVDETVGKKDGNVIEAIEAHSI